MNTNVMHTVHLDPPKNIGEVAPQNIYHFFTEDLFTRSNKNKFEKF